MPECSICGEKIAEGSRTCSVCGSSAEEFLPVATGLNASQLAATPAAPADIPPGGSYCPACAKVYGPEHGDAFCECGTWLLKEIPGDVPPAESVGEEAPPMAPIMDEAAPPMAPFLEDAMPPMAPIMDAAPPAAEFEEVPASAPEPEAADDRDAPAVKVRCVKPASGTPCLVLYGPDKQPLQYFALAKDAMTIGRLDAVAGIFPDIDLDEWFDRPTIRKISRQHAVILRTRATNTFALRPLAGNTGTQLDAQMVQPAQDYPLKPGHRIILGGVIRLKFEIA